MLIVGVYKIKLSSCRGFDAVSLTSWLTKLIPGVPHPRFPKHCDLKEVATSGVLVHECRLCCSPGGRGAGVARLGGVGAAVLRSPAAAHADQQVAGGGAAGALATRPPVCGN